MNNTTRTITVRQTPHDSDVYRVVKLVNCVEPTIQSLIKKREVEQIIRNRRAKVIVLPPGE